MYKAKNMADVKRFNKEVGNHYFDKDTMKFWGCKIETELLPNNLFVTSDDNFDRSKKLYTLRKYNPEDAMIETVGEFQAYKTLAEAKVAAQEYKEA